MWTSLTLVHIGYWAISTRTSHFDSYKSNSSFNSLYHFINFAPSLISYSFFFFFWSNFLFAYKVIFSTPKCPTGALAHLSNYIIPFIYRKTCNIYSIFSVFCVFVSFFLVFISRLGTYFSFWIVTCEYDIFMCSLVNLDIRVCTKLCMFLMVQK